jgi:hypothetical protein
MAKEIGTHKALIEESKSRPSGMTKEVNRRCEKKG